MTLISVVVCAHNRASLLEHALESLFRQSLSPHEYELPAVDNNSTDHTKAVALSYTNGLPKLSYFYEPKQDLSHARNRGRMEAEGTYVGYFVDDSTAPKDRLQTARVTIDKEDYPHFFGGSYYPYYLEDTPSCVRETYGSMNNEPVAKRLGEG